MNKKPFIVEEFLTAASKDENLSSRARLLGLLYLYEDDMVDTFAIYREFDTDFILFLFDDKLGSNDYSNIFGPTFSQIFEWCTLREKYEI